MAVSEDKKRFMVTFSKELTEKMDAYCRETGISKSAYLAMLVTKDLDDTEVFLKQVSSQLEGVIARLDGIDG